MAYDGLGISERVREVLREHAGLVTDISRVAESADLFALGMSSYRAVEVMLALEEEFDIEFPEDMLEKSTFSTVGSIESAVRKLQVAHQ
jgi:acyl carrier protein